MAFGFTSITIRTSAEDVRFASLVTALDAGLRATNGEVQTLYTSHNRIDPQSHVVLVLADGEAVACGAFRKGYAEGRMEVKRMFVLPEWRSKGLSRRVLQELEAWGKEMGYRYAQLETGTRQTEAQALYLSSGYQPVAPFGPYADLPDSLCYEKAI